MDNEAYLLIHLLQISLGLKFPSDDCLFDFTKCDWQKIQRLAVAHGVDPLVYGAFRYISFQPPQEVRAYFYDSYRFALLSCVRAWQEFLRIITAFEALNISVVPLKGLSFLEDIYAHIPVRIMRDIDLLIKPQDYFKAEAVLCGLGYSKELEGLAESYWKEKQYHILFTRKSNNETLFRVELHWKLDYPHKGRLELTGLWDRTRTILVGNRQITILSAEDSFMSLALHQRRFGNPLALKNIIDVALLLKQYLSFDWDYVLSEAWKAKSRSVTYFILLQAKMLLCCSIPQRVWDNLRVGYLKRMGMKHIIHTRTFAPFSLSIFKENYLKLHFLLYDNFWEPFGYFFHIPQEQFAKYYGLAPYSNQTGLRYRYRGLYMPGRFIYDILSCRDK